MIDSRDSSAPSGPRRRRSPRAARAIASVTGGTPTHAPLEIDTAREQHVRRDAQRRAPGRCSRQRRSPVSSMIPSATATRRSNARAGVGRQIEHVAIQQGELAVELAEDLGVRAADEHEVRPEESEEGGRGSAGAARARSSPRSPSRGPRPGARDVPALANDVVQVRLSQQRERLTRRRHDRIGPGQKRHALILDHLEQRFPVATRRDRSSRGGADAATSRSPGR